MQLPAIALIAFGSVGTIASVLYFVLMREELELMPLIISVFFFSGFEAAGALLLVRHRR